MILEFISTAVETQPGLVELFLDLSSKEDQVSFLVTFYEKQTNNQIIKTSQKKCVLSQNRYSVSKDGGCVLLTAYDMSSVHCLIQTLTAVFFIFWCLCVSAYVCIILY